jgi:hypothetical protein
MKKLVTILALALFCTGVSAQPSQLPTSSGGGSSFQSFTCTTNGTATTCAGSGNFTCTPSGNNSVCTVPPTTTGVVYLSGCAGAGAGGSGQSGANTAGGGGNANIIAINNDVNSGAIVTPAQSAAWTTATVLQIKGNGGCSEPHPTIGGQPIGESGTWSGATTTINNGQAILLGPCESALIAIQP